MIETKTLQGSSFAFPAKRVFVVLMAIICSLTLLNILSLLSTQLVIENYWLQECRSSLIRLFYTDGEANIPSWYSSSALLASSALLYAIVVFKSRAADDYQRHWKLLAVIFLYLSLDEAAMGHEMLNKPVRAAFNTEGLLYFPWVLVAGVCLILLLFVYKRFLLHLPSNIRILFISSGIIFVFGAIGVECLGSYNTWQNTTSGRADMIFTTTEEFLEMTGIALFIYALMRYLNEHVLNPQTVTAKQLQCSVDSLLVDGTVEFKESGLSGGIDSKTQLPNSFSCVDR